VPLLPVEPELVPELEPEPGLPPALPVEPAPELELAPEVPELPELPEVANDWHCEATQANPAGQAPSGQGKRAGCSMEVSRQPDAGSIAASTTAMSGPSLAARLTK
jgi:hypothetical protein